jgi:hypothetical protein
MLGSGTFMEAFTDDGAILDHHRTNSGIGMGVMSRRELKRAPQSGAVEQVH